jgi:FkbM family methyltransferase
VTILLPVRRTSRKPCSAKSGQAEKLARPPSPIYHVVFFIRNEFSRSKLDRKSDPELLAIAQKLAWNRPIELYPGWTFEGAEKRRTDTELQARRSVWSACADRAIRGPIEFPWYGAKLWMYLGSDFSRPAFIGGCIEPNEFYFLNSILSEGMVMLDIGANHGIFSIFASPRIGAKGRIFAFEPSLREVGRLRANIRLNSFENIEVVQSAAGDENGVIELTIAGDDHEGQNTLGGFAYTSTKRVDTQKVQIQKLDDFVSQKKLARLDIIKMDVEGAEFKALAGAKETLLRFKPILLLELQEQSLALQGSSEKAVVDFLKKLGYTIYDFSSETGGLIQSKSDRHSDNIVAGPPHLA